MKKRKTRTIKAEVFGVFPSSPGADSLWKVRLKVPRFPFYLDSVYGYVSKAAAESEAEEWKRKTIKISITQ